MRTARKALTASQNSTPEIAFRTVADAFADEVGAASGALYEGAFEAAAKATAGKATLDMTADWAAVYEAMAGEMQSIGKAEINDKTMLDAWLPAARALREAADAGAPLGEGLSRATAAAWAGVENTKNLIPKRGRASRLGERARGYQDAGATSAWLIIKTIGDSLS
jgi:dihydroxyacetone kinase-like protein